MPKPKRPRFGSMGVWPRKRAKRQYAKVRSTPTVKESRLLAFPAYKAGMTSIAAIGWEKGKREAGIETIIPVTVLECPAIRIAAVKFYKKQGTGQIIAAQLNFKPEKELERKTNISKKKEYAKKEDLEKMNADDYSDIRIQIYTQPKAISLKKKPETFEVKLGGTNAEKLEFIKNHHDKPITIQEVFKEGQLVDAHGITTGKGFQGPVKRFGIGLKNHKSEKGVRAVGSLGGWSGQGHVMYRVAHAGQMGYHQRVQYNNQILKISDKPEEVNPAGGFVRYGNIKGTYVLVKGTLLGPKKRMITLAEPIRPTKVQPYTSDSIKSISTASKQGR